MIEPETEIQTLRGRIGALRKEETAGLWPALGGVLREWREYRGYSQRTVADQVGLSPVSIINVEKGRQRLPLDTLWTLCRMYDVKLGDLVAEVEKIATARTDERDH